MKSLEEFKQMLLKEHESKFPDWPETPARYLGTWSDKKAGGLTKMILKYLRLKKHHAERVNTTGMPRKTKSGKMIWTFSGGMKGSADIHAIVQGRFVAIEIKVGRDVQSHEQILYEQEVQRSGGCYIIARDFETFVTWYKDFLCNTLCNEDINIKQSSN
jgi:hypothetical protein